jgi:diaminopimelate decarboxylase
MFPGADVCLRVNAEFGAACHDSNITAGPDCKFGISKTDIAAAKQIVEQYNLRVVGLHAHNGSGWLSIAEPLLSVDVLLETAREFKGLSFIDIGGGFGVPYAPTDVAIDIDFVGKSIVEKFARYEQETGERVTLRLEPGRYFVAEACALVAEVTETKQLGNGRPYVGINTSMSHLIRPALYGSYHDITNVSRSGEEVSTDIGGDVCECADYFATKRLFPKSEVGDIIAIATAGAYGFAMSSEYQFRPRPIEILVDGEEVRVIRKRETVEDLLKKYE